MRKTVITVIVVGVVVVLGGVIFAVGGGDGGDRRASIGGATETADKAAPERSAPGKPVELPPGQVKADQADKVVEQLGPERSAGAYFDRETDAMIVTVLDDAAGAAVRSKGGQAKLVKNSGAKLAETEKALKPAVEIAGVAYGVDVVDNKVLVTVDGSVANADRNKIKAAVQAKASTATLEEISGEIKLLEHIDPYQRPVTGELLYEGDSHVRNVLGCTRGFHVVGPPTNYPVGEREVNLLSGGYLTAGHCDKLGDGTWDSETAYKEARTAHTSYVGTRNDYALIEYTRCCELRMAPWVSVYGGPCSPCRLGRQVITSSGDAYTGQLVRKSGDATRVTSGTVTGVNQTVTIAGRTMDGMIRATACASHGDSGGPLYAGTVGLGITSSGAKNADGSCVSYHQNVREALTAYGVRIMDCTINDCGVNIHDCASWIVEGDSGHSLATLTVTRSGQWVDARGATVNWAARNSPGGVATSPGDYVAKNGTVSFAPGETVKLIQVPVVGDTTPEQLETFEVVLAGTSGDSTRDNLAYCRIQDDD